MFSVYIIIRPVESHSGARRNILVGPLLRKKCLAFSFQNGAVWCIIVLLSDGGPSNVTGPGVAYPPIPPSRRA